ncbi:MAG: 1-acyl-sn-glycerol-3-phosphate acyltransferase [Saprospiraceae bacterium]|nr:1-acyl-sn-glycerol-3-phosphate acyltransferase [Saprospiraceae bacterium]
MIGRPETKEKRHQYLLKELANSRFKKLSPINTVCWGIALLLYAPIGFCLFGLRTITLILYLFLCYTILPKKWRSKLAIEFLLPVLGLKNQIKQIENLSNTIKDKPFIMVCNHISYYDSMIIKSVYNNIGVKKFSLIAATLLGGKLQFKLLEQIDFIERLIFTKGTQANKNEKEKTRSEIINLLNHKNNPEWLPILVFPEGQVHSGKFLLRYEKFCFGLNVPILPVAARLNNPWPVNLWRIQEYPIVSTFWFLFLPWVEWDFTILSLQNIKANETASMFAQRIQGLTASELKIDSSDFTLYDFSELL